MWGGRLTDCGPGSSPRNCADPCGFSDSLFDFGSADSAICQGPSWEESCVPVPQPIGSPTSDLGFGPEASSDLALAPLSHGREAVRSSQDSTEGTHTHTPEAAPSYCLTAYPGTALQLCSRPCPLECGSGPDCTEPTQETLTHTRAGRPADLS